MLNSQSREIAVLHLNKFETQILPQALEIKERIEMGGHLDCDDRQFLETMVRHIKQAADVVDCPQKLRRVKTCAARLFNEITIQALKNERQRRAH